MLRTNSVLWQKWRLVDITRSDEIKEHNNVKKPELYKIHYRGETDNKLEKALEKLADQLMNINQFIEKVHAEKIKSVWQQMEERKETKYALRRLVCELLDSIRFLFKESHYSEEKEVRVIQLYYGETNESSGSKIKVDVENIPPHFYVEAPENFRFGEVILGPRTKRYQEWEQWLKAEAKKQEKSIDIKRSKIRYGKS